MIKYANVFQSYSTNDIDASRQFYGEVLGIEIKTVGNRFLYLHITDDHPIVIYQKEDHQPASFTVLNFQVSSLELVVDQLMAKGITFLQYGPPIQTDIKGISWDDVGSHIAWFKDPGGNILALIEN